MTDTLKIKSAILTIGSGVSQQNDSFPWDKAFPDLLWIFFWLLIFFFAKEPIFSAVNILLSRLKHGAAIKIGTFEMDAVKVSPATPIADKKFHTRNDKNNIMQNLRSGEYAASQCIMLVHKIFKSQKNNQLYDILIYVIPHQDADLGKVESVEYFFGAFWNDKIFKSTDIRNGFAIATSAYGSFLCCARINYRDGSKPYVAFRYIDFEMGETAPMIVT